MALIALSALAWLGSPERSSASPDEIVRTLGSPPCQFTARFEQRRDFPDGVNFMRTGGTVYHDCRQGLVWSTETPIRFMQVFSERAAFDIADKGEVRRVDNAVQRYIGSFLAQFLRGDTSAIAEQFEVSVDEHAIVLNPRTSLLSQFLTSIRVVRGGAGYVVTVRQTDEQGLALNISNIRALSSDSSSESTCTAIFDNALPVCELLAGSRDE